MSNTLFLNADVWENLRRGLVVFNEGKKHAFYTCNEELILSLKQENGTAVHFDEYGDEIDADGSYGVNGLAYNLLTKQNETIFPATFGGVISTVAFAELPAVKEEDEQVEGYKTALVLGELTGALSVSTRFLEKNSQAGLSLKDIGVKDDKVVVLPAYVHVKKLNNESSETFIDGLYLLKA